MLFREVREGGGVEVNKYKWFAFALSIHCAVAVSRSV